MDVSVKAQLPDLNRSEDTKGKYAAPEQNELDGLGQFVKKLRSYWGLNKRDLACMLGL